MGHHSFLCVVCDNTFERDNLAGNFVQLRKLCDNCIDFHKWCPHGRHAPLRSAFSPSSRANGDGLQWICRTCLPDNRGNIRVRSCGNCQVEFIPPAQHKHRFNGMPVVLCEACYALVKYCKRCETMKPREDFATRRDCAQGVKAHCRECDKDRWRETPTEVKFARRANGRKFDITHDEWIAMRTAQNDLCAICGQPETVQRNGATIPLSIDHCHTTGQIRALLCSRCNTAIGQMLDDPVRLRAAADYVERWAAALAV